MPFIDKTKIGLEGHSFGGYETNYLVTGSGMFAAACAGAGVSNFITHYGSIMRDGNSRQSTYEKGQLRLDGSLWQAPEEYIKNSPVFKVNNITTPILLMNNKGDGSVPFDQGVEMLTALRRSGKKAWMLQYDGEDHSLGDEKAAMDFTIRLTQFFDHYLKDARAPEWMQDSINN